MYVVASAIEHQFVHTFLSLFLLLSVLSFFFVFCVRRIISRLGIRNVPICLATVGIENYKRLRWWQNGYLLNTHMTMHYVFTLMKSRKKKKIKEKEREEDFSILMFLIWSNMELEYIVVFIFMISDWVWTKLAPSDKYSLWMWGDRMVCGRSFGGTSHTPIVQQHNYYTSESHYHAYF